MTKKGEPHKWIQEHKSYLGDECLEWPYAKAGEGRGQIWIHGKHAYSHRVMCIEVNGQPPSDDHIAAHSCGNGHRACMTPGHLRWATQVENEEDKIEHGTSNRGTNSASNKLTVDQVHEIRESEGLCSRESLAEKYSVHKMTVRDIQSRKIWAWLPDRIAA